MSSTEKAKETAHEDAVETILVTSDKLFASTGDAPEMVSQARVLGQATAHLIQSIKGEAEKETDADLQRRLLAAAKQLADATTRMVEAARLCASTPHDASRQSQLRSAVEDLRSATITAASPNYRRKLIVKLESAAKQAASSATQCIAAAQAAAPHNVNKASQEELLLECRSMAGAVPRLVEGVKGTMADPDSSQRQAALINASEQFLQVSRSPRKWSGQNILEKPFKPKPNFPKARGPLRDLAISKKGPQVHSAVFPIFMLKWKSLTETWKKTLNEPKNLK